MLFLSKAIFVNTTKLSYAVFIWDAATSGTPDPSKSMQIVLEISEKNMMQRTTLGRVFFSSSEEEGEVEEVLQMTEGLQEVLQMVV